MKGDPLGILAICRKAGRLKWGFDSVASSLGRDAALVLFADDVSPKTKERMQKKADGFGVKTLTLPRPAAELWRVIGTRAAVLAITDKGLADKVASLTEYKEELDI